MAKQVINIGSAPNDNTGDTVRAAFNKTNLNFTEVYDAAIYGSEIVTAPTTGTLTLKLNKETYIGTLTDANVFTVALPTPVAGLIAESILIFKVGASLPTITQPVGIVWRGAVPTLAVNTSWTICYEQVNTTGSTYEIWAVAVKNV